MVSEVRPAKVWYAFDHHLGHANILTFRGADDLLIRPGFRDIDEHDEVIIARHNSVVADHDTVYFGGDVTTDAKTLKRLLPRFRGTKKLIMGNHDNLKFSQYREQFYEVVGWVDDLQLFKSVRGSKQDAKNYIANHYPIHPMAFEQPGGVKCCVHGHIHEKWVMLPDGTPDRRYLNLSMERINYTPVSHEQIMEYIRVMIEGNMD